jgi:hypothetical protein
MTRAEHLQACPTFRAHLDERRARCGPHQVVCLVLTEDGGVFMSEPTTPEAIAAMRRISTLKLREELRFGPPATSLN